MCCPNVVLVEKAVSRDVQESLQAKGITLVFDMKLPRLERIARCTGSHIVSSAEGLLNAKLKQCDTFRTEKVVEEYHFSYNEGARRLAKTLMFFEGCPIPLFCTVSIAFPFLLVSQNSEISSVGCVPFCCICHQSCKFAKRLTIALMMVHDKMTDSTFYSLLNDVTLAVIDKVII